MKKTLKIIAIVLILGFVGIQFIRPNLSNPPVVAEHTLEATTQVPDAVERILTHSCNDCHSNKTIYPLYAQIAPSSWFMASHIDEGRRQLNFSEWSTYETRRKRRKLDEVCDQVKAREMPLPSYLWIHWGSKLSDEEIKTLCDWTESENARLENE